MLDYNELFLDEATYLESNPGITQDLTTGGVEAVVMGASLGDWDFFVQAVQNNPEVKFLELNLASHPLFVSIRFGNRQFTRKLIDWRIDANPIVYYYSLYWALRKDPELVEYLADNYLMSGGTIDELVFALRPYSTQPDILAPLYKYPQVINQLGRISFGKKRSGDDLFPSSGRRR